MKHCGTECIETDRLLLRPFTMEDAPAMFTNWASDPEVTRYLTWPTHDNIDTTAMVLADWIAKYEQPGYYQWAIVPKDIGVPVGSISVVRLNERVGKAEIGYCIGSPWWHRGITSEALGCVMRFLMDKVGVERIEACFDPRNPYSGAVMRKCGMQYEGTQRQADINNSGKCDLCWYAILASDRSID